MVEEEFPWIVVVRGEAEGREVRVALEFQDADRLLSPTSYAVGPPFLDRLLDAVRRHDHWVVKTIIEEVRSPEGERIHPQTPLFALLSRSHPMGLAAGALFVSVKQPAGEPTSHTGAEQPATERYSLTGLSPAGFAAACSEDRRLFPRFITRLLKRPQSFTRVSLLLPRATHQRRRGRSDGGQAKQDN